MDERGLICRSVFMCRGVVSPYGPARQRGLSGGAGLDPAAGDRRPLVWPSGRAVDLAGSPGWLSLQHFLQKKKNSVGASFLKDKSPKSFF